MAASSPISWSELFQTEGTPDFHLKFSIVKKAGQPFLLLPQSPSLAARSLSLYPAQSSKARLAKKALFMALRVGIPLPLEKATVGVSNGNSFVSYLKELIPGKTNKSPPFAILAGNPNAEGRRFILLLFDDRGQPAVVVKAGIGESAKQLIRKESIFLQSVPSGMNGLPAFRSSFSSAKVEALALDYIEGDSPQREDRNRMETILSSWMDHERRVLPEQIPAWQILQQKAFSNPLFARTSSELAGNIFHPVLFHGDFAPWNIKVSSKDGSWTVLDWERGEHIGFPGWDWFHYIIQTGVLVEKQTPPESLSTINNLLQAPAFQTYAGKTGIAGHERSLVVAYLLYCVNVLRPTEGLQRCEALLSYLGSSPAGWRD
jgi:hypothetical protein